MLTNLRKRLAPALMAALAVIAAGSVGSAAEITSITGVVTSAAGEPVAGALVKVSGEKQGIAFMVVSQEQGLYSTPNLLPGTYVVQAFGGTHQSAPSGPVKVGGGERAKMDVILTAPLSIPPREKRMTDSDYAKLMPQGPGKQYAADQCATCHSLLRVVSARKTREQWQEVYDRMLDALYDMRKLMIYHQPSENNVPHSDMVLGYLAKNYGPDAPPDPRVTDQWLLRSDGPPHPNRNLPPSLLKGTAAKYLAMEVSLPDGAQARDIAVDSEGIAWVSEENTGKLGRFDPNTLAYARIAVPVGKNPKVQLNAVEVDSSDQVWFADDGPNGRILQYKPKSREFTTYLMPEYRFLVPPDIGWARIRALRISDGAVWAMGDTSNRILKLDITNRKILDYSIPKGSMPFGLVVRADGSVWYSAEIPNQIVKLDPATAGLTKYYVPLEEKERADLRGLEQDTEGNLWVASTELGKLLKLDTRGHFIDYTPPTPDSGPYAVDVDTEGNFVWFSQAFADRIARFDPRSNTFIEFSHPSADAHVGRIEVDRSRPNRVWWAGDQTGKIGYIETLN